MPHARFGLSLCLALSSVVLTLAVAQAEPASRADREAAGRNASIVLVGAAARDSELEALLGELLARRGVHASISKQDEFGREQLLHAEERSGVVLVFVVPGLDGYVGLYFRAPDGQRFLLRNVLLRGGFDDVGRELVGQVVETAVASLQHAGDSLTREQAQLALAKEAPATAPANPAEIASTVRVPARAPAKVAQPRSPQHARANALEGWLALRYGAVAFGARLGIAHGPGLELGLGLKRNYLLRGRMTFERDFPQSLGTSLVAAELSRTRWRLAADAGLPLTSRHFLLVSLGVGQDRLHVVPSTPAGSDVAPARDFLDQAPVALAELRYEAAFGPFRVAAVLGADFSLVETHYDVAHATERESVVKPWLVRPSAGVALAFCPRLATF